MERNDGAPGPDVIRLVGLGGVGRHGVEAEEREHGQTFLVDLDLHLDTSEAAATDDLASTVNYADVARQVIALVEGEPVNLIETLAARIADTALAYALVEAVDVTVHKPEAPVGVPFTDMQVRIRRERSRAVAEDPSAPVEPVAVEAAGAEAVGAPAAADAPVAPAQEEGVPVPAAAGSGDRGGVDLDRAPDQPAEVVLGLGGNVGEVRSTLRAVVEDLRNAPGLIVRTVSPLARTAAVLAADAVPQQDYLNAVVLATTTLSPNAVLELARSVEAAYGRERTQRWGERTVDIDVIAYDGISSSEEHLQLPHPRASERAFVLVPWAQADPDAFLPGLGGGPVAILAETAPDRGGVRWLALDWLEPARSRTDSAAFAAGAGSSSPPAAASGPEPAAAEPDWAEPAAAAAPAPVAGAGAPDVPGAGAEHDGGGSLVPPDPVAEEADAGPAAEGVVGAGAAVPGVAAGAAVPEGAEPEGAVPEGAEPEGAVPEGAEPGVAAPEVVEPATIEPDTGMPPTVSPTEASPTAPAVSPEDPGPEADPALPESEESDFQTQIRPAADGRGADGEPTPHFDPQALPGAVSATEDPADGRPSLDEPSLEVSTGAQPDAHRAADHHGADQPEAQPAVDEPVTDDPAADQPDAHAADQPDAHAADQPQSGPEAQAPPAAGEQAQFRPRWQPLRGDESS